MARRLPVVGNRDEDHEPGPGDRSKDVALAVRVLEEQQVAGPEPACIAAGGLDFRHAGEVELELPTRRAMPMLRTRRLLDDLPHDDGTRRVDAQHAGQHTRRPEGLGGNVEEGVLEERRTVRSDPEPHHLHSVSLPNELPVLIEEAPRPAGEGAGDFFDWCSSENVGEHFDGPRDAHARRSQDGDGLPDLELAVTQQDATVAPLLEVSPRARHSSVVAELHSHHVRGRRRELRWRSRTQVVEEVDHDAAVRVTGGRNDTHCGVEIRTGGAGDELDPDTHTVSGSSLARRAEGARGPIGRLSAVGGSGMADDEMVGPEDVDHLPHRVGELRRRSRECEQLDLGDLQPVAVDDVPYRVGGPTATTQHVVLPSRHPDAIEPGRDLPSNRRGLVSYANQMRAEPVDVHAFRLQLRRWLDAHVPDELRRPIGGTTLDAVLELGRDRLAAWNAELAEAGYAAISWPEEYGGRNLGPAFQAAYAEELHHAGAPGALNLVGIPNIGPAIMGYGTEQQRARYLRPMLRGEELWCQGFSEPNAGSDLSNISTRAVRVGDEYRVTGQKVWTSVGHLADWCELLVRTTLEAPARKAMTCLLVDLRQPGVVRQPLRTMAGTTEFAELFFDDVSVPVSARLGPEGEGWRVAMSTLAHERANFATLHLRARSKLRTLLEEFAAHPTPPVFRALQRVELADLFIRVEVLGMLARRTLADPEDSPRPESNVAKILWSDIERDIAEAAGRIFGMAALDGPWAGHLLRAPGFSIAGGTSEIVRNTLAERVLGLPRA